MKKRILALALAGTTAFSVFGAAMSANAANSWSDSIYDSTHDQWNIDRYESYVPAGDLDWNAQSSETQYGYSGITGGLYYVDDNARTATDGDTTYYTQSTVIYVANATAKEEFDGVGYTVKVISDLPAYGEVTALMDKAGYAKFNANNGVITDNGKTYYVGTEGDPTSVKSTFKLFTETEWNTAKTTYKPYTGAAYVYVDKDYVSGGHITGVNNSLEVYLPNEADGTLNEAVVRVIKNYADSQNSPYYITTGTYSNGTNLTQNVGQTRVIIAQASSTGGVYPDRPYTKLDSTDPTDFDAVMANTVQPSGEIYLYDYYGNLPNGISADMFTTAWGNGTVGQLMSRYSNNAANGTLVPDAGRYGAKGVREDVVDAWENFLDDLGISDASSYRLTAWAEDTVNNYLYKYYGTSVVTDWWTDDDGNWQVTITNLKDGVDLYNFEGLIADILELAPAYKVATAQTSEMVYLMQQYNKYMDGYVDENPVETDEWGDLLVSLAQAPTSDEFATNNAYKRYTNAAEDLIEAYEEADTASAVRLAEIDLFDFVTSYTSAYKYDTKGDNTALGNALDSTVFNYDWTSNYSVNSKNYTAEDYVGAFDKDGVLAGGHVDKGIGSNGLGAYALYPYGDYVGSVNDGSYPGVENGVYGVTQEYFWFYNVYNLAYNVYTGNKYQSTLDLMTSTLEEAIDALVPSDNASASEILGAEEQNDKLENLVETDYTASMWSNRNKINTYINDRVSNDEIGSYGSTNAKSIASQVAEQLGYQKYQTTVTRSDINSVSAAKTQAQTALTNLRNDEENYNAAQANALQKAIDECDVIIDLYNGDYSKSAKSQSVNGALTLLVGDKDQILKSDCTNAVQAVEDAINFSNIIMGWSQDEDGNWMYGTEEGYLNDGWHQVDGGQTWFYFNEDGTAKQSEWWQNPENGYWYWFNSNCGAAVGWAKVDGNWYYFKGDNHMKTGWEKVEGSWYYMDASGKMVTGWCQINGTWYYFSKESNALGQMLANTTTPDGYKVDANGALVE